MEDELLWRGTNTSSRPGFYEDAIKYASEYHRAAGYFSISVFATNPDGFKSFFSRGGTIELVCSGHFRARDVAAIVAGLNDPRRWAGKSVEEISVTQAKGCFDLVAWAVANGRLQIKIAEILASNQSLYHEKFGIFFSQRIPLLAFDGSANETWPAYRDNFELVNVYRYSTSASKRKVDNLNEAFERLWKDRTPGLRVVPFFKALRDGMIRVDVDAQNESVPIKTKSMHADQPIEMPPEVLRRPDRFVLRGYQQEAVRHWFANNGCGILEMATGSGKTFTALAALTELYEKVGPPLAIIVIAPYIHLVEQWADEASKFGLAPVCCFGSYKDWYQFADSAIFRCNKGERRILSFAVTNATFRGARFQRLLNKIDVRTVLVADEVHNLGASRLARALPSRVSLRMGLSATPTRWMDKDGTDRLQRYFGDVVFRFGLEEALKHDPPILAPYRYFPVLVELEDDETEEYVDLTAAIGRCISDLDSAEISDLAMALLIKRSRLIASARQKLHLLKTNIAPFRDMLHMLIYCGDSSVEFGDGEQSDDSDAGTMRQIDAITSILGHELGMAVAQFTADTPGPDRSRILRDFSEGSLQALVAIRCLDEGVNIPSISRAFILASSTNPRQFIQRRGRILRCAPGKTVAEIYDFVVHPPNLQVVRNDPGYNAGRRLITNEMRRVVQFASLATNGPEARARLLPILQEWDLLHL